MSAIEDALLPLAEPLTEKDVERVLKAAFAEDLDAAGDITSDTVIPPEVRFSGVMEAREECIIAGLPVAQRAFRMLSGDVHFAPEVNDGAEVAAGQVIAHIEGPARALLAAERTALNILQLLSGMATLTREYVRAIEGTKATLLDTRKTIPGLRRLSKYATRMGGAQNHRMGLYDAILIKDNHIAVTGSIAAAVRRAKEAGHAAIEVECDTLDQVREAVEAGATRVLLDNMAPETLREAVALVAGRAETEASGGVTLENIRQIAETGVDYISTSRITMAAPAIDIGLDWR